MSFLSREPQNAKVLVWSKPSLQWWKANWDYVVDKAFNRMGMGIVIHDHCGEVVAARSIMINGRTDPMAREALTSLYAVKMCKELGGQAIILEGDAKNVVDVINSEDKCGNHFGHLVEDARQILKTIPHWRCEYVNQTGNEAAHALAKRATKFVIDKD